MKQKREIYDSNLPHRAVAVYLYLWDRANQKGMCFPGIKRISSDLSISVSTVKRAVSDLERAGYISKENCYRANGGKTSNRYYLL